jgi:hypothetical protein
LPGVPGRLLSPPDAPVSPTLPLPVSPTRDCFAGPGHPFLTHPEFRLYPLFCPSPQFYPGTRPGCTTLVCMILGQVVNGMYASTAHVKDNEASVDCIVDACCVVRSVSPSHTCCTKAVPPCRMAACVDQQCTGRTTRLPLPPLSPAPMFTNKLFCSATCMQACKFSINQLLCRDTHLVGSVILLSENLLHEVTCE